MRSARLRHVYRSIVPAGIREPLWRTRRHLVHRVRTSMKTLVGNSRGAGKAAARSAGSSHAHCPPVDALSPYHSAVLSLASQKPTITIAIVGANDGRINDPVYALVRDRLASNSRMILFEPQEALLPHLRDNYGFHGDYHIVNCAIGNTSELELHSIRKEFWGRAQPSYACGWPEYRAPTGITSSQREFVIDWVVKNIPNLDNPEDAVEQVVVTAKRLPDALREEGLPTSVDVLQIDAEGEDDQVIYGCMLGETAPAIIHFESRSLPEDRLHALLFNLGRLGYVCYALGPDTLAIREHAVQCSP